MRSFLLGLSMAVNAVLILTILHSGKKRALQTALILADRISSDTAPQETDGLSPKDDPGIWAGSIAAMDQDIMLVGHLPHLAKLASLLLSADKNMVDFENAGIVCMKRTEGDWAVDWIIKPRMLK